MLAGEKEELRLRPRPAGWWPHYLGALWFLAVGALLLGLANLPAWHAHAHWLDDNRDQATFWVHLWGTPLAMALLAGVLLVAAGFIQRARRERNDHLVLNIIVALAVASVAAFVVPALTPVYAFDDGTVRRLPSELADRATWLVPLTLAAACVAGLLWAELRRATTSIHVTNVRTVLRTAIPAREHAIHHADLADIDRQRAGLGAAHHLSLVPRQGDKLRLRGVPDAPAVAELIALLAQRATATDYLRKSQDLDARIVDAIAAFHRR